MANGENTTNTETKQQVEAVRPEHALPFATHRRNEIMNLWGKPTTGSSWCLTETEGQMRAIAVLGLEVDGERPSDKAVRLGSIFRRIARDQFDRRRTFLEIEAIASFWGLVGELAAAYAGQDDHLGFAAKVVCRRGTRQLVLDTEQNAERPRRKRGGKAVRS